MFDCISLLPLPAEKPLRKRIKLASETGNLAGALRRLQDCFDNFVFDHLELSVLSYIKNAPSTS